MARYLVVRCESNDSADKLMEKFAPLEHVNVVGLFVACTKFCECPFGVEGQKVIRSKKWGTSHCSVCKLPFGHRLMQHPLNLLARKDLHPYFDDLHFSVSMAVREPFTNEPEKIYGEEAIRRKNEQASYAGKRVGRAQRRRARKRGV
jgi:hypothetical protein